MAYMDPMGYIIFMVNFIWIFRLEFLTSYNINLIHEIYHENCSVVGSYCRAMISIYIYVYYIHMYNTWCDDVCSYFQDLVRPVAALCSRSERHRAGRKTWRRCGCRSWHLTDPEHRDFVGIFTMKNGEQHWVTWGWVKTLYPCSSHQNSW
jgi:hypothetical protein